MDFKVELTKRTEEINRIIHERLPKQEGLQKLILEAAAYSVNVGGKRLRPMILLETYKLCGGKNPEECYDFCAALECIHSYSLVHDDLPAMDNDMYRRGNLTTHAKYGEDIGILAGDALLNFAYELMLNAITKREPSAALRAGKAASVIAQKAGVYGMVGGQTLDVYLTGKKMNAEQLDFIFRLKTGALIEAAFMAGAILAGADEKTVSELEEAGLAVGIAFQIRDDILDITSTQEVLGKPIHSDERNEKTTYVSLYGMEKAEDDVLQYSKKAENLIRNAGDNEFLIQLTDSLINRVK
jgi:geranylgeranyl diphosphate synthase type II